MCLSRRIWTFACIPFDSYAGGEFADEPVIPRRLTAYVSGVTWQSKDGSSGRAPHLHLSLSGQTEGAFFVHLLINASRILLLVSFSATRSSRPKSISGRGLLL